MSWSRSDADKLANTARAHIMKNRFGMDGMTFQCRMDTIHGVLDVLEPKSADGILATKEAENGKVMERQLLLKKYQDLG